MKKFKKPRHKQKSDINKYIERSKRKAKEETSKLIKFSFKYLTHSNSKFDYYQYDQRYYLQLLNRIKEISGYTVIEFRQKGDKSLRSHAINWEDTTERCFGIPNETELVDQPWQFAVSVNEYGRVHGFIIGEHFYIVWLDKNHKLYN